MKLLLPIFNGLRARNFFLTDLYPELLAQGVELVILAPSYKCEYYRATYAHPNVVFEAWDDTEEPKFARMLQWFAFNALGSGTVKAKQYLFYVHDGNLPRFLLRRLISILFGRQTWVRKFIRALDYQFVSADPSLVALCKKHDVTAVLAPDIVLGTDRIVLRVGRALKLPTVGMVRSWDNLTAKGVIQVLPDYLIAQTDAMKKEAIALGDMDASRIRVCGVTQFDEYWKAPAHMRAAFLQSLGIPADRRIILCATFFGESSERSGVVLVNALAQAIDDGRLPKDIHLLVRYRPEDPNTAGAPETKDFDHPRITTTKPYSKVFTSPQGRGDYEFTHKDVDLMVDSLRYSDVTINTISTLTVDAVALDKPVINVRFDADPNTAKGDRVELYSHFDHYLALEKTGGVRLSHSLDELLSQINAYLENPKLDEAGREEIRKKQIEFFDAFSGKRSAEAIVAILKK